MSEEAERRALRCLSLSLLFVLGTNWGGCVPKESSLSADKESERTISVDEYLKGLLAMVHADMPFDVSPRYVNFRPSKVLDDRIKCFLASNGDAAVKSVEDRLFREDNPYLAIALLYMLHESASPSRNEFLQRYREFVAAKSPFPQTFPGKREVLGAIEPITK